MISKIRRFVAVLTLFPLGFTLSSRVRAQIIPDNTLPQPSTVTVDNSIWQLSGGTPAGNNLFHSFHQFNVGIGETAYFNNALNINHIITRVTGGNLSSIDGLIRANGTANLFLINPNGILFGAEAQLDIGGSFFATTADSLQFNDGLEFKANGTDHPQPLLSINVPIGLQFGTNPGTIINRASGNGLQVQPDRTLALVGGNLFLEGGNLSAPQGRIVLSSVTAGGIISLSPTDETPLSNGGTIELSQEATVNASGLGGGAIQVRGGQVSLTAGSKLVADTLGDVDGVGIDIRTPQFQMSDRSLISASTFGSGAGGDISVTSNSIDISGTEPGQIIQQLVLGTFNPFNLQNGIYAISLGSGAAGNLSIEADETIVRQGAGLFTTTFLNGMGGQLNLQVTDTVEVSGGSILLTGTAGMGNAGDLTLTAEQLHVLQGSAIATSPNTTGQGKAGNLTIQAGEIELLQTPGGAALPNGLFVSTLGEGAGGKLNLTAHRLVAAGGSQLTASSSGAGAAGTLNILADEVELSGASDDGRFLSGIYASTSLLTVSGELGTASGGDLTVTAEHLLLENGGQISTATGNSGSAGNVNITGTESVTVRGFATGVNPMVEAVSFGVIGDGIVPSAIEANTQDSGTAGDVTLRTSQLTVSNGAEVGVRGTNAGAAGNLDVIADTIVLENAGSLSASTVAGTGGNIHLQASALQLRNGSRILTDANTQDGGNITIDTNTLVSLENSDITANALQGKGGRVTINTQGIFGTQFREILTPDSDITATSDLGPAFRGVVTLNTPEVQSSVGVVELDAREIDPKTLVTVSCRDYQGSELIITGRGGLPPDPTQPLTSERPWQDLRFLEESSITSNPNFTPLPSETLPPPPPSLIEATGWRINDRGQVELIAEVPNRLQSHLPDCSPSITQIQ